LQALERLAVFGHQQQQVQHLVPGGAPSTTTVLKS